MIECYLYPNKLIVFFIRQDNYLEIKKKNRDVFLFQSRSQKLSIDK